MGVRGRKYAQTWAGVRCGGGLRIGAGGRKYTHTCTKVRNIGAKVRCGGRVGVVGSGQGCAAVAVQVRTYVDGGAQRWGGGVQESVGGVALFRRFATFAPSSNIGKERI